MTPRSRTALITGASAGIGAAFAQLLAAEGYDLLLVARRESRLHALAERLTAQHEVSSAVLAADLASPAAPQQIFAEAQARDLQIDVLINNAGLSGKRAFATTPWPVLADELQVQVNAPTELVHLALDGMRERQWGRIVNLSSLAAFQPPGASLLYTGIKSYVLNMSQALDMELKPQGINVTALCPGFTHTEFHDVMGTREAANKLPSFVWGDADSVARAGWSAVMSGKPVCVPGTINKFLSTTMRPVPLAAQYALGRRANPFKQS